jgi:hypothetical protein
MVAKQMVAKQMVARERGAPCHLPASMSTGEVHAELGGGGAR